MVKIDTMNLSTTDKSSTANSFRGDKMRNVSYVGTNGNRWREFGRVAGGGKLALSGLLSQEQELSNHQQMSKWTNMRLWRWFVCKYLSWGAVKGDWGECWGAQLRLLTQSQPPFISPVPLANDAAPHPLFFTSQISVTQNPLPPNTLFKKAVSLPKLRAPTLRRGSRGEGSKVNCSSLGWNELWWQVVLLMCQQWRSNRPRWNCGLSITLTARITINLSSAEHGDYNMWEYFYFLQISQKNAFDF